MTILNLHDRRAIEAIVERMDTDAIERCLDDGGLSALAREAVAHELARRVLGGEVLGGARSAWCLATVVEHVVAFFPLVWSVFVLVRLLGLFR